MVSLKAWNGEIESVGELVDTWVQVTSIPPKWADFEAFQQVASTVGLQEEINWGCLFSSYFQRVRLKIACKGPAKIPKNRLMEFGKKLYIVNLKVEGHRQEEDKSEDGGDDDDPKDGSAGAKDETGNYDLPNNAHETPKKPDQDSGKKGSEDACQNNLGRKTVSMWASLFKELNMEEGSGLDQEGLRCTNLLQEMELVESDNENFHEDGQMEIDFEADNQGSKTEQLPEEWCYEENEKPVNEKLNVSEIGDQQKQKVISKWGPVQAERRSKRVPADGRRILQKAQSNKKRQNLETEKESRMEEYEALAPNGHRSTTSVEDSMPCWGFTRARAADIIVEVAARPERIGTRSL